MVTSKLSTRLPLSRERILNVALDLADTNGLDSVSMRQVAQGLGVEAMSLYKHVSNKEDLLDGIVELVVAEMSLPSPSAAWKDALRERAYTVRKTLNSHPWAANLIESRSSIGPMRLRHNDSMIGILRKAGFSIELAFHSMIALTSYVYGFVILEEGNKLKGRPKDIGNLQNVIHPSEYPYIFEMINFAYSKKDQNSGTSDISEEGSFADFEFGLNQLLDGFERVLK
ncbi:MAG: TetR/AcrR family transcriptional regulator [Sideroxydans sp.]|nr:TetR/AcrR family transcriptional regulator [Sideroxydans sp.]